jgi:hypothetical protein
MTQVPKSLVDYADEAPSWWGSNLSDYQRRPATAFLREAVHIADAIRQCRRLFKRRKNGKLNKDSQDSVYRLSAAALSSIMSHFETYQRSLFAGMIEATRFVPKFDLGKCRKRLEGDSHLALDIDRLLAHRGQAASAGHLIADSLTGWHVPTQVNSHFLAVEHEYVFFSGNDTNELFILWQMRHSIVHTAGWLTHADAQKVPFLLRIADKPILLNEQFIAAVARRLHGIVSRATAGIGNRFLPRLTVALSAQERARVEELFEVQSPRPSWLKAAA